MMTSIVSVASLVFALALCVVPCCRNFMDHQGVSERLNKATGETSFNPVPAENIWNKAPMKLLG